MTGEKALERYWVAQREFEAALRAMPPKLLGLTREDVEQMLADIDPPGLEEPPSVRVRTSRRQRSD